MSALFFAEQGAYAVDEGHRVGRSAGQPQIDVPPLEERAVDGAACGVEAARTGIRTADDQ